MHRGEAGLRSLYELFFSNGGGIPLEHCTMTDDSRACALEYSVVQWARTEMPPEAGVAVYVRGNTGKLAVARIYDDSYPSPYTARVAAGSRRCFAGSLRQGGDVVPPRQR